MVKKAFSTLQILRYPIVFGACLAAYFTAFSYRKTYFKDEIDQVRDKNLEQGRLNAARIEAATQQVRLERAQKESAVKT